MMQLDPTIRLLLSALAAGVAAAAAALGQLPSGWRAGIAAASAIFGALGIIPPHLPASLTLEQLPTDAQELAAPPPPAP